MSYQSPERVLGDDTLPRRQVQCAMYCSPEARDDPALWNISPEGEETCLWNSSRAESNNAWLEGLGHVVKQMPLVLRLPVVMIATFAGLGHVVKQMPLVLRDYFLSQAILVRNETLLNSKLMSEDPNFDG